MFKCKTFGLFFLLLLLGTHCQALEGVATSQSKTDGIVSPKSRIEIVVPGFTGAKVEIKDFEGTASYNVNDITETEYYVKMNLQTADAGIKSPFMKSEMFLDAAHYPYASFKATHNEAIDEYSIHMYGNLTLKGVTRPIVITTVVDPSSTEDEIRHTSTLEIDRREWGIDALSGVISNTIKITLHGVITPRT
jgi:polyisoprenoid-binding protein YceI